ncbi:MAG: hypothetical protein QOG49_909, partial [Frankiaceae bacterium]|nr:hypothetical protein [Frankiaceae bacterium]
MPAASLRTGRPAIAVVAALVLVGAAPASAGAQTPSRLIVSARAGVAAAAAAVERVGGHVLDRLPLL